MEITSLAQFFQELVTNGPANLMNIITSLLTLSPFQDFISEFSAWPYMGWVNWFVPVKGYLIVWAAWINAVGVYYLYQAILRWVKAVE